MRQDRLDYPGSSFAKPKELALHELPLQQHEKKTTLHVNNDVARSYRDIDRGVKLSSSYLEPGSRSDEVKLTVVVSSRQYLDLERQAKAHDISVTRAIRRALDLYLIVQDAQARGARVLVREADGTFRGIEAAG